ncbi:flagellar basal body rod modification protein [Pelomyxa schiedti]|nr:flagellar basal body rod modification protein [Pelomyxa schiedti]
MNRFVVIVVGVATFVCLSAAADIVNLDVPMVHQKWDVPTWYDGSWGCGPTSTLMAVAYWGRLLPYTIWLDEPDSHTNDYGWYVPNVYTWGETTFNVTQDDASGNPAWGAYGWCTVEGAAWAEKMQSYANQHNLLSDFNQTATLDYVKLLLDKGHVVVLDTWLTSSGHIITVRGYDDSDRVICNDPYGNANNKKTYGTLTDGENVYYTWDFVGPKWMIDVYPPQ